MDDDQKNRSNMASLQTRRIDGNFHVPIAQQTMPFTGERLTSEVGGGQIEFEHYHRYCFARDFCDGRDVLDVASGEGYGTALLAGVAREVIGVDIDAAAVEHANASYIRPNLRYMKGDVLALPVPDDSVDIVISFETLEHISDHAQYVKEVRRVLRPGGLLIVSTPDRSVYSAPGAEPNPYHALELTHGEFRFLLESSFKYACILRQRPVCGSVLVGDDDTAGWRTYERRSTSIIEATSGLARAHYLLGIASESAITAPPSSSYLDWRQSPESLKREKQYAEAVAEYQRVVDERGVQIMELQAALDERDRRVSAIDERGLKLVELLERLVAKMVSKLHEHPTGEV